MMQRKIFITGATDGIGFETAKMLVTQGHYLLLHGRNKAKLESVKTDLLAISDTAQLETYLADLSVISEVKSLAKAVQEKHKQVDVLINNAGVYSVSEKCSADGLDIRFVVNSIAPLMLTRALLPQLGNNGRVLNLSSAAQASINLDALRGATQLNDCEAYAQSKLALTIWSRVLGLKYKTAGPVIIAINPKSLLATKMVKEAFAITGSDVSQGAEVLCQVALCDEFSNASGLYYDNDKEKFTDPHPDALDEQTSQAVMNTFEKIIADL